MAGAALLAVVVLVGCGGSEETGPSTDQGVPLADAVGTMKPEAVWRNFSDLTQVPRPSHHEQKATAFVADFGRGLGLQTTVDDLGNVVIHKPATDGMEKRPVVVLQSHLDMVPQQTEGSSTDFETEPINAFVQDGWVHADGTTLGADDGIGVATTMAILAADDLRHGPIEALFTVNEEDGMSGMAGLASDALKGRTYLNLDNEVEGSFVISSAGGVEVQANDAYEQVPTPSGTKAFVVTVDGLLGGHSGMDIDKGRGSAHQLMARLLVKAPADLGIRVADLVGGELANVIPAKAAATVVVPKTEAEAFGGYVKDFDTTVKKELEKTDPGVAVTAKPTDLPSKVMQPDAQNALVGAVHDIPQGVRRMSEEVPGMVETSSNLGVLAIEDGTLTGVSLARSAKDPERDAEAQRIADVWKQAGAGVKYGDPHPAWPPNPDSALLELMQRVYQDRFGKQPQIMAIHAGLEAGTAIAKYPGMDIVSVGPTLESVHSVDERLKVDSVAKAYDLIVATLEQVK